MSIVTEMLIALAIMVLFGALAVSGSESLLYVSVTVVAGYTFGMLSLNIGQAIGKVPIGRPRVYGHDVAFLASAMMMYWAGYNRLAFACASVAVMIAAPVVRWQMEESKQGEQLLRMLDEAAKEAKELRDLWHTDRKRGNQ